MEGRTAALSRLLGRQMNRAGLAEAKRADFGAFGNVQVSPAAMKDSRSREAKVVLDDVSVTYGLAPVAEHVSFSVAERELVCIIGRSGCGKTTLLHVMAGLLSPISGTVTMNGRPVTSPGPDRVMVFQADAVFPWMSVQRNVEYGLAAQGVPALQRRRQAGEVLSLVGLAEVASFYPRQLSGGMRKRVDLARALVVEPEMLLMDEPYAALDMMTKERLQVDFSSVQFDRGITVIFVTHDLEEALFLGDRVVVMGGKPGRITDSFDIPFDRPRNLALKRSAEFQRLRGILAECLDTA